MNRKQRNKKKLENKAEFTDKNKKRVRFAQKRQDKANALFCRQIEYLCKQWLSVACDDLLMAALPLAEYIIVESHKMIESGIDLEKNKIAMVALGFWLEVQERCEKLKEKGSI
jgi:hypothetical protein